MRLRRIGYERGIAAQRTPGGSSPPEVGPHCGRVAACARGLGVCGRFLFPRPARHAVRRPRRCWYSGRCVRVLSHPCWRIWPGKVMPAAKRWPGPCHVAASARPASASISLEGVCFRLSFSNRGLGAKQARLVGRGDGGGGVWRQTARVVDARAQPLIWSWEGGAGRLACRPAQISSARRGATEAQGRLPNTAARSAQCGAP